MNDELMTRGIVASCPKCGAVIGVSPEPGYVLVRRDDLESLYGDSNRLIEDFGETDADRERKGRIDAILGRKME